MDSLETERLFYYFQYVKKNLFLIAAIDWIPGIYESQVQELFQEMHQQVQIEARKRVNFLDYSRLQRVLKDQIVRQMHSLNPPCPVEHLNTGVSMNDLESGALLAAEDTSLTGMFETEMSSFRLAKLTLQQNFRQAMKADEETSWFMFIFGRTRYVQLFCTMGILMVMWMMHILK